MTAVVSVAVYVAVAAVDVEAGLAASLQVTTSILNWPHMSGYARMFMCRYTGKQGKMRIPYSSHDWERSWVSLCWLTVNF